MTLIIMFLNFVCLLLLAANSVCCRAFRFPLVNIGPICIFYPRIILSKCCSNTNHNNNNDNSIHYEFNRYVYYIETDTHTHTYKYTLYIYNMQYYNVNPLDVINKLLN